MNQFRRLFVPENALWLALLVWPGSTLAILRQMPGDDPHLNLTSYCTLAVYGFLNEKWDFLRPSSDFELRTTPVGSISR
jgi:hypothetical protein